MRITPAMVVEGVNKHRTKLVKLATGTFYDKVNDKCVLCPISVVLAAKLGLQELVDLYEGGREPSLLAEEHLQMTTSYMWGFINGYDGCTYFAGKHDENEYRIGYSDGVGIVENVSPDGTQLVSTGV